MCRAWNELAQSRAVFLHSGQSAGYYFVAVQKRHLAGGDFAYLLGKTVIDLVTNDEETEKRAFGLCAEVNRLHKGLVEMVRSEPPVAGIFLVERFMKILLRPLAGKCWRVCFATDQRTI